MPNNYCMLNILFMLSLIFSIIDQSLKQYNNYLIITKTIYNNYLVITKTI